MAKNVFYFKSINNIGGVESFLYYIAKKYAGYDIVVYYKQGDLKQISRLRKYVKVIKYNDENIKCDKIFLNYNYDIIDKVEAKEYIQVIHCNYMKVAGVWNGKPHPKINKYIGVSQEVCDAFTERTGLPCELCYHPVEYDFDREKLLLVSAQRMDTMKGLGRIQKLARELDKQQIPYVWLIYTNTKEQPISPNVVYMESRLDIANIIKGSSYFIALSDHEAYNFSVVESLMLGVPVVRTPIKVFDELGIDDTMSIVLDFDCGNIQQVVKDMVSKKFNFKYTPPKDRWNELLSGSAKDSKYQKEREKTMKARVLRTFTDKYTGETYTVGDEITLTQGRYDEIQEVGNLVEEIETPKEEIIEESSVKTAKPKKSKKKQ